MEKTSEENCLQYKFEQQAGRESGGGERVCPLSCLYNHTSMKEEWKADVAMLSSKGDANAVLASL